MIAWFARNSVAANLLMAMIVVVGLYSVFKKIPLEVFPSFELDVVNVTVEFRGATPTDVENNITVKVEEAIQDLEGIKTMTSAAREGFGAVTVEVASGYDARRLMEDIKVRVDAINTFPAAAQRPVVKRPQRLREVISVVASGDLSETALHLLGERIRDDLVQFPEISQVELVGVREYEIAIEVPEQVLRRYGLSLSEVARVIRNSSLDLPAGLIKSAQGEILIRSVGQSYVQADFEAIVVRSTADGGELTIGDIATVIDGFEEQPLEANFNNQRSVQVDVFSVGDQSAIQVADRVKQYIAETNERLPPGVELGFWRDRSEIIKARLSTLSRSALQGGALILLILSLFLRWSVAFWVFLGIPISFFGGLALMPLMGVTINLASLFAFILVLGIVVDDAIVTGENIYTHMKRGSDSLKAAIEGTREVAVPVTFGILTTIAAFVPILSMEGRRAAIFAQIPMIVIPVLLFSLVESKLILPAHLRHVKLHPPGTQRNWLSLIQNRVSEGLERGVRNIYQPFLTKALNNRYLTLAVFLAFAILIFSMLGAGHIRFIFFPKVQSEVARAVLEMPAGTGFDITAGHIAKMTAAAQRLQRKYIDPESGESVIKNVLSTTGYGGRGLSGLSNVGRVMFEIESPDSRAFSVTSSQLVREWRRLIGPIAGAKDLTFRAEIGRGGQPLDVQITGQDFARLKNVAATFRDALSSYPGVFDVTDSYADGKQEIEITLRPMAEHLGLSLGDIGRQVRQAFFGEEVQRIQRGRNDVRVMVRYPLAERQSLQSLANMRIRTADGTEVPFAEVASAEFGRSPSSIKRVDRMRAINVSADVNKANADVEAIKRDLRELINKIEAGDPSIGISLEGEAREQRESFNSLVWGSGFVLFVIYTLLAISFRSYSQPLMVMSVIPFGLAAAILGHIVLGMSLTLISLLGMLALIGVVVNDSLVLVDYVNRQRAQGEELLDAVRMAGVARFRAVLLTSLTTFFGLTPLLLEKTTQAQFLIPMAVSLGFGILFATFITLVLIPVNYMILEDIKRRA